MLRQAGDRGNARHRAERDDELPPGDVLHFLVRLDVRRPSGEIDARHSPEQQVGMRAHDSQRDHAMTRLECSGGRFG